MLIHRKNKLIGVMGYYYVKISETATYIFIISESNV